MMVKDNLLRLVSSIEKVASDQTVIKSNIDEAREESREIRKILQESATSLATIAGSIKDMNDLAKLLIRAVILPLATMVFILALLFAGVKFTEITGVYKVYSGASVEVPAEKKSQLHE